MGVYLSKPNTDKNSEDGCCDRFTYGATSMQGWRQSQEDAHNCIIDYDSETCTSLFAVYDGHGGSEVAQYCRSFLPEHLKSIDSYKSGSLDKVLQVGFMEFDKLLCEESTIKQLKNLAGYEDDCIADEEDAEKKEAALLIEEATMPLEEVLAKYRDVPDGDVAQCSTLNHNEPNMNINSEDKDLLIGCSTSSFRREYGENVQIADKVTMEVSSSISDVKKPVSVRVDRDYNEDKEARSGCSVETSSRSYTSDIKPVSDPVDGDKEACSGSATQTPSASDTSLQRSLPEEQSTTNDNLVSSTSCGPQEVTSSSSGLINVHTRDTDKNSPYQSCSEDASNLASSSGHSVSCSSKDENVRNMSTRSTIFADDDESCDDDDDDGDDSEDANINNERDINDDDDEYEWEDLSDDYSEEEEDDDDDCIPFQSIPFSDMGEPGSESGCTALVGLLRDYKLWVANVGDSRCVLCRGDLAVDLSIDHKPEDDSERCRIEAAGGKVTSDGRVNGGLNLSRAIGDHFYKHNKDIDAKHQMISAFPDVKSTNLTSNDHFIIFACDGIWNVMTSQEAVDFVRKRLKENPSFYRTPSKICEEMFDRCLATDTTGDGTGCDNMTCILLILKNAPQPLDSDVSDAIVMHSTLDLVCKNGDDKSINGICDDSEMSSSPCAKSHLCSEISQNKRNADLENEAILSDKRLKVDGDAASI